MKPTEIPLAEKMMKKYKWQSQFLSILSSTKTRRKKIIEVNVYRRIGSNNGRIFCKFNELETTQFICL